MAVNYRDIIREIALRVNALAPSATTPALKETALAVNPYTATEIGNIDFPFTAIQRAAVAGVVKLVRAYAFTANHPFRRANLSSTANIANKALIPSVDASNKQIVGVLGEIRDATSNEPLTAQPKQIIESIISSKTSGALKKEYYHYCIIDGRISHTRTNVIADVVTLDLAAQKTAAAAGTDSPLPDALYDLAWAAGLSVMLNDDAYAEMAGAYSSYVNREIAAIGAGATTFPAAPEVAVPINPAS